MIVLQQRSAVSPGQMPDVTQSGVEAVSSSAISALKWHYAGTAIRSLSQFVIGVVLARMLGPEPLGVVAAAWIVIGLGNLVADFGFAAAVIQKPHLSEADIRHSFTLQLFVGTFLTVLVAGMAPVASRVLALPALVPVLRVLSALFLLQALGLTGSAILRRRLDYKSLQQAQAGSYFIAYFCVGLLLAWLGFGIWSLVAAQLLQSLLLSAALYHRTRHAVRPLLWVEDRSLAQFGVRVLGTNLVNWLLQNIDNVSVSRAFGVVALGLYNRAYMLLMIPIMAVVAVVQAVLFSAAARAQDSPDTLRQLYLDALRGTSLVLLPLFAGIAVAPSTVIEGLYGDRWRDAAPLLPPLAIAFCFYSIMALATPVLQAAGRVTEEFRRQLLSAVILLLALALAGSVSVVTTAWIVCGVYVIRCVLMTSAMLRLTATSWREMATSIEGGLVAACCVGVTLALVAQLTSSVAPSWRLAMLVSIAGFELCGILLLHPAYFLGQSLLLRLSNKPRGVTVLGDWLLTRAGVASNPSLQ